MIYIMYILISDASFFERFFECLKLHLCFSRCSRFVERSFTNFDISLWDISLDLCLSLQNSISVLILLGFCRAEIRNQSGL